MRATLALLVVLTVCGSAVADPPAPAAPGSPPVAAPPAKPAAALTSEQAADAVLAAIKSKDDAAVRLKELATAEDPDPWMVVEALCRRGRTAEAVAFARADASPDLERLPDYVLWRESHPAPQDEWSAIQKAIDALNRGKPTDVLAFLERLVPEDGSTASSRIPMLKAAALSDLHRLTESRAEYLNASERASKIGWLAQQASCAESAGRISIADSDATTARATWIELAVLQERRRSELGIAVVNLNLASASIELGRFEDAIRYARVALSIYEKRGDSLRVIKALINLGNALRNSGAIEEAVARHERALKLCDGISDKDLTATVLTNLSNACTELGEYTRARDFQGRALELRRETRNSRGTAHSLAGLAQIDVAVGDARSALRLLVQAQTILEKVGNSRDLAFVLGVMGVAYMETGDLAKSLDFQQRGLEFSQRLNYRTHLEVALGNLANLYSRMGRHEKAIELQAQSLKVAQEVGARRSELRARLSLARLFVHRGKATEAARMLEETRPSLSASEDSDLIAGRDLLLAQVHLDTEDAATAKDEFERLHADLTRRGRVKEALAALVELAILHERLRNFQQATNLAEAAAQEAEDRVYPDLAAISLATVARTSVALGKRTDALKAARRALMSVLASARSLSDADALGTKETMGSVFQDCLDVAFDSGGPEDVLWFVETARDGMLLRSLGRPGADLHGLVSTDLLVEDARLRIEQASAVARHRRALNGSDMQARVAARKSLDDVNERRGTLLAKMQTTTTGDPSAIDHRSVDMTLLQRTLGSAQAMILYHWGKTRLGALVVTQRTARTLRVGEVSVLSGLVRSLSLRLPDEEGMKVIHTLRQSLIGSLDLAKDIDTLLISPDGDVAEVPFGLLVPDLTVSLIPSASVFDRLASSAGQTGDGVLAIGDPSYDAPMSSALRGSGSSGRLGRLPGTGDEAKAVGDVVLIGERATEQSIREAWGQRPRWKAVHFACHGLVNPEHAEYSCLAVTPSGGDDGFITVQEIIGMRIPADLVVLSACDSGTGTATRSEGLVGLPRAFLASGAQGVICSLWPVDDEATRTLMVKFYELWNPKDGKPGLGAATALKQAQAYVSAQENWKDPKFWAAWQLWGLPE